MAGIAAAVGSGKRLTVQCTPASVAGTWDAEISFGTTDMCEAVVDGGKAPYTYSWTKQSGDTFTVSPSTVASMVAFQFSGAAHKAAQYRVTVTDAFGRTAYSDVSVTGN